MVCTLYIPVLFLALVSHTIANLLYDPGFESFILTRSDKSSTGDPILNGYPNNDPSKIYNSNNVDFEIKQYNLSSSLMTNVLDYKMAGAYVNYCQNIQPAVGQDYFLIFNIYLDPVVEYGKVYLRLNGTTFQTFNYNKSRDGEIVITNTTVNFSQTPTQLCLSSDSTAYVSWLSFLEKFKYGLYLDNVFLVTYGESYSVYSSQSGVVSLLTDSISALNN